MCIYCPLVILIIDQFLNEHLTHETFTVMNVMILDLFSDKTISYLLQMKSAERITVWLV